MTAAPLVDVCERCPHDEHLGGQCDAAVTDQSGTAAVCSCTPCWRCGGSGALDSGRVPYGWESCDACDATGWPL